MTARMAPGWPNRKVSSTAIGFNWKPKIVSLIKLDANDSCKNTAGNRLNYIRIILDESL